MREIEVEENYNLQNQEMKEFHNAREREMLTSMSPRIFCDDIKSF